MPFKRAGWLQLGENLTQRCEPCEVSMPFKRAGWLQQNLGPVQPNISMFQCPLSGLVGCNCLLRALRSWVRLFQCPLSGLVGCNLPRTNRQAEAQSFNAL